jgi:hypothetical protein
MIYLIYLAAVIIATIIHFWLARRHLSRAEVVGIILLYIFVFFVGLGGIMGALAHTVWAEETALKIGWQPGSPFQFEIAMANLAFGVLGILCIWQWGGFWTATGIGVAVILLGCTYGHVREIIVHQNYAPYNAGVGIFFNDVVIPVLILGLLWARARLTGESPKSEDTPFTREIEY